MVIIIGASKGIGRYLYTRFKEIGEQVIGTYNSTNIIPGDDFVNYFKVNILDYESIKSFINGLKPLPKKIILINCAAKSYNSFAHKSNISEWDLVIDINLKGIFHVIREFLPIMRENSYGRIINFSSVVTKLPTMGVSAYAASKSAIIGLTKSLAAENGSKGITINTINLGYTNLGMGISDVPKSYQDQIIKKIPIERFCYPEEVFLTVQYLIHTEYVNGASIDLNGGLV